MNNVRARLSALVAYLIMVGCTSETSEGFDHPSSPSGNDTDRREVMMTLKNTLNITPAATKAGDPLTKAIAIAFDNHIASLDVYVFGSATEDGEYTFQERFGYREDPDNPSPLIGLGDIPAIALTPGANDNQYNAVLRVKKGLFVKFYIVVNCPTLGDPSGAIGTWPFNGSMYMSPENYKPLELANPGSNGTTVQIRGVPTENEFTSFHSVLHTEAYGVGEIVMTGAWTTPIDLTDFSTNNRLQAGFKLTRAVARFDIVNNAAESKFTITSVSMRNGRRGVQCFPITTYGTIPATAGDLITYSKKKEKFELGNPAYDPEANIAGVEGAIYCYPSPTEDEGHIILEGTYQANLSDAPKNVVYQVPFTQDNGKGGVTTLSINPNHRYTIAITKADDYHVDFNITADDWKDADDINGFEPSDPIAPTYTLTIDQGITDAYLSTLKDKVTGAEATLLAQYPPFNFDQETETPILGTDHLGISSVPSIAIPYTIEVENTQENGLYPYYKPDYSVNIAKDYCKAKGADWRVPTLIELYAMWHKCKGTNTDATDTENASTALGMSFMNGDSYWSSSVYNNVQDRRCLFDFSQGSFTHYSILGTAYIRCVREK